LLLLDVRVSGFSKLRENIVDQVLFTVTVQLSLGVEGVEVFFADTALPGLVLVTVISVAVAIMHDHVVGGRLYITISQTMSLDQINLPLYL
jgi:hypothetical protein